MKKDKKPFVVEITQKGSINALPAIWYGGLSGQRFNVTISKQWPSFYEVIDGPNKERIIDPKDCQIIPITK